MRQSLCRNATRWFAFRFLLRLINDGGRKSLLLIVLVSLCLCGCRHVNQVASCRPLFPLRSSISINRSGTAEDPAENGSSTIRPTEKKDNSASIQLVADQQQTDQATEINEQSPVATNATNGGTVSAVELPAAGVTLAELESIAVTTNPTLMQAQAAVSSQMGLLHQAGLYPNPQIGYINGAATNPAVKQSNGFFVSQEFVTAGKLDLAQQSALQELSRYQWDFESQRRRVLNDLKIRYYEVLGAQEANQVARRMIEIGEKNLAIAESNLSSGYVTKIELINATVQLETIRLARDDAEARYLTAWEQLATMIGISSMTPVPLNDPLADGIPELDFETCWQELLSNSPQLRSNESDLGHARALNREAVAQAVPNFTVQMVGEYDQATQASTYSTLVALPLPMFNRNQGNIEKTEADICAAEAEIRRVQLVLRDQLAVSYYQGYLTSRRRADRLKTEILPRLAENLELTQGQLTSGQIGLAPVLLAQQDYFKNQIDYVNALTELHKVVTEIQGLHLTGGLNPAAIGSAIQNQPGGSGNRQRVLLNEVQDRASKALLPAAQLSQ